MTRLPDFRLETYFSRWEFTARFHLTASDAQTMRMSELLALADHSDRAAWESYAADLRVKIQRGAGLEPWPERTPLNAAITARREHDGYTVENVRLETRPGVFAWDRVDAASA